MQENEPQKLVEKVAGDIESLLDRKVQALKVGQCWELENIKGRQGGVALTEGSVPTLALTEHLNP